MAFNDFPPQTPKCTPAFWCCLILAAANLLSGQDGRALVPRPLGGATCSTNSTPYDVVVIGAGLSGLTAAKELKRLEHSVLVLEANDRIGGRGYTADISGVPIDYGGAWLHGVPTNPLVPLADAMGFTRKRTEFSVHYYVDDRIATNKENGLFEKASEEYETKVTHAATALAYQQSTAQLFCASTAEIGESKPAARLELVKNLCDQLRMTVPDQALQKRLCASAGRVKGPKSATDACRVETAKINATSDVSAAYLPKATEFRDVLPLLAESAGPLESATELTRASAYDGSQFEASDDDLIGQGFGRFVQKIGEDVPVCLNSRVTAVHYGSAGADVRSGDAVYHAKRVLVTVSVGVLRAKRIAFDPPLPAWKQEAIDHLQMGNLQKIIIPFSRDIFPSSVPESSWITYEGNVFPAGKRGVMGFVIKPLGKNMAIGFFGGEQAKSFEQNCAAETSTSGPRRKCDDPAIETTHRALVNMFKGAVDEAILRDQIHVTRWSLDETSLGAYSVPEPGFWHMRETLRQPVGEEGEGPKYLYFSGEATSRAIFNGSFAGAYETGMQAAREIHTAILESKPRTLHRPSKK